jgi:hypothetical protein
VPDHYGLARIYKIFFSGLILVKGQVHEFCIFSWWPYFFFNFLPGIPLKLWVSLCTTNRAIASAQAEEESPASIGQHTG